MNYIGRRDATSGASVRVKPHWAPRPRSPRPYITLAATSLPTLAREYVGRRPAQAGSVSN